MMVCQHCKCKPPTARRRRMPPIGAEDDNPDAFQIFNNPVTPPPDISLLRYTFHKQLGIERRNPKDVYSSFIAKALPDHLEETEHKIGEVNKVFASQWLSDRQVVYGTKCNKLIVLDVNTGLRDLIPSLKGSMESLPADCPCGIHSIAINPSRTMLATGAMNTNDVAVYRLPTFDPVCVGEGGHDDWVFDMRWLDDEFLVTGSRDSRLALWHIKEGMQCVKPSVHQIPQYSVCSPKSVKLCQNAEKVRALEYNKNTWDLAAVSLNAHLHIWDTETFTQKASHRLRYSRENVCLTLKPEMNLYAVGSQSHVTFICPDVKKCLKTIHSSQPGNGIRSVSFQDNILTFGTGAGSLFFYDIRACKYLQCNCGQNRQIDVGQGWLKHDETYRDFFTDDNYPNAIYTHCYDDSGTRLFTAGGPLPAGLWGNYAGVWQ